MELGSIKEHSEEEDVTSTPHDDVSATPSSSFLRRMMRSLRNKFRRPSIHPSADERSAAVSIGVERSAAVPIGVERSAAVRIAVERSAVVPFVDDDDENLEEVLEEDLEQEDPLDPKSFGDVKEDRITEQRRVLSGNMGSSWYV